MNMNILTHISTKNLSSSANMSDFHLGKFGYHLNSTSSAPSMSISKLFPALLQCFGIILCGYIAGRVNIITSTQAKGLGNFVSRFALPALLFKNMVVLNFSNVNWSFLYSILVAKASVFFLVCILTLLVANPERRFSRAGLFPIFATQSNDFALGYPIVEALYQTTYPEYLQYIYLVAPISLMMLNPLGFIFCEIQKSRDNRNLSHSKFKIVGLGLLRVLQNPIVFMVFIGIASNFILGQKIPEYLENFLDGLASSFSGSALFYLGLTMVGQIKKLTKGTFVALILLITAKLLLMPLLCREMVELLDKSGSLNHTSLSNYAFLYGVFPAAPGVAIFATQFNMEVEIITSGMVISTFVSAPIMYVSAWLLTIPSMDSKKLASAIQTVSFDISIVSLVSLVWSLAVVLLSKKYKQLPHMLTTNLLIAQFVACIGMVMWNFAVQERSMTMQILVFAVLYTSLYSTFLWTGLLSLSLLLLKKRETVKIPVGFFTVAGWGIPALLVGILLMAGQRSSDIIDSAFFYGKHQMIITAIIVLVSIMMSGVSLMCMNRSGVEANYEVLNQQSQHSGMEESEREVNEQSRSSASTGTSRPLTDCSIGRGCCACEKKNEELCCSEGDPSSRMCVNDNCPPSIETANRCVSPCSSQTCILAQEEQILQTGDKQLARHVLLCLLLVVGLFANLSSCLWWLFNQEPGILYVELQFFCAVFNFGQGFISFGIFGLDKHLIILPFKRRLEFLWGSREKEGSRDSPVPEEIRMTCQQFVRYHKEPCVRNIVQDRRCGVKTATGVFFGCDLVNWLVEVGLALDRGGAVVYGDRLVKGGVIQHITNEFEFRDERLHYRFIPRRSATKESYRNEETLRS